MSELSNFHLRAHDESHFVLRHPNFTDELSEAPGPKSTQQEASDAAQDARSSDAVLLGDLFWSGDWTRQTVSAYQTSSTIVPHILSWGSYFYRCIPPLLLLLLPPLLPQLTSHTQYHTPNITQLTSHSQHHTTDITLSTSHTRYHTSNITHSTSHTQHTQHHTTDITHSISHTQHHTSNITHSTSHTRHHTLNITHSTSHN